MTRDDQNSKNLHFKTRSPKSSFDFQKIISKQYFIEHPFVTIARSH